MNSEADKISVYPSTSAAASSMRSYRTDATNNGFRGTLFWTWNNIGQPFWTAKEGNKEIRNALSNVAAPAAEDDFNDENNTGWGTSGGHWSVEYGQYNQDNTSGFTCSYLSRRTFSNFKAWSFMILLGQSSSDNWSGFQFRKTNPTDAPWQSGYSAYMRPDGTLSLYKAGVGDIAVASTGVNPTSWVKLTVQANGNTINVYVNDVLYITKTDSTYTSGYISFASYNNHTHFNDLIRN